ncbi:hypothetical protein [Cupriavidus sp. YAF13]|uniref:hypothetical protein n=1 Tax=Cupriavidus sp. YAF13 TaxID=3233075 RepID=UPI003F91051C
MALDPVAPRELPMELAALLGCAVMAGIGAVANTAQVRMGQGVAVLWTAAWICRPCRARRRRAPRAYIALYCQGKLPVARSLTGTLGLEDIHDGFGRQRTGQAIRQMVTMGD